MSYASGGLIAATDYNGFVGSSTSTTSGQINAVWSTGNGNGGYGQSAVSQVSSAGTVTATQWSSLINTLNNIYNHQSGSGSGISAVTSGSLISYLSALSGDLGTIYTNRLNAASQGSTTTGTVYNPNVTATNTISAESLSFTRTVTFSSGDAARYFFNAGGQINFVTTAATSVDGSGRSNDMATLVGTYLGSVNAIKAATNGGKSGTGGTVNTNATSIGYYSLTTSDQTVVSINSGTYTYTGDYVTVSLKSNGAQGSNADKGSVIYIDCVAYSGARLSAESWNQTINFTWSHRVDIVYPESTYLSNSWGTVTVS